MKRTHVILIGLVILSFWTLGCGLCNLATQKGQEIALTKVVEEVEKQMATLTVQPGDDKATATPKPGTKPTNTPKAGATPTAAAASTEFKGLDTLNSYRSEFRMNGNDGGQEISVSGSSAWVKEPRASDSSFETRQNDQTQQVRIILIKDDLFMYSPEAGGWIAMQSSPDMVSGMDLSGMLIGEMSKPLDDKAFKLISEHDDVNGMDCRHYQANAKDLSENMMGMNVKVTEGTVDVWVSNKWGVAVQYSLQIEGTNQEGKEASVEMSVWITDINESIEILPPDSSEIIQDMRPK